MKKLRRAHLWIGLIASVFIFFEALTGLLMSEPWLIGQSGRGALVGGQGMGFRGNFQQGQFNQGQFNQGQGGQGFNQGQNTADGSQTNGGGGQAQNNFNGNGQFQGQNGFSGNGQFNRQNGFNGNSNVLRNRNQNSLMAFIRNLHQGMIGGSNIKWLNDLISVVMMVLTGTGIYLSINVLRAEAIQNNRRTESL